MFISLVFFLIFLFISVFFFLRKKATETNQRRKKKGFPALFSQEKHWKRGCFSVLAHRSLTQSKQIEIISLNLCETKMFEKSFCDIEAILCRQSPAGVARSLLASGLRANHRPSFGLFSLEEKGRFSF